jgi:deoxyribose-phosphate aldolase
MIEKEKLAGMIDHTILKSDTSEKDIRKICDQAIYHNFWSVCLNPSNISLASNLLRNSKVKVTSVVGFPLGASTSEIKIHEAKKAFEDGADEIDMVWNLGEFKSENYEYVTREIESIVDVANSFGDKKVKVIIESGLLNKKEKILACKLVKSSGADFVKTSTGFSGKGANIEDVRLFRNIVGEEFGVKASGGIKTYEMVLKMIKAGANRIGTSSGVKILLELSNFE